jgi:hypothetical protein
VQVNVDGAKLRSDSFPLGQTLRDQAGKKISIASDDKTCTGTLTVTFNGDSPYYQIKITKTDGNGNIEKEFSLNL